MSLVDNFQYSSKNILDTIHQYSGIQVPFKKPTEEDKENIKKLIILLDQYDNNPIVKNEKLILKALDVLDMGGLRLKADPNAMIFFQNNIIAKGDGVTLLWRQGKVQVPSTPDTYKNKVMGAFISNEHVKKDHADQIAIRFFLEGNLKGMLCNGIAFGYSNLASPCQPKNKITDVAHSDVPLYYSAISQIVATYPKSPITNLHGMRGFVSVNDVTTPMPRRAIFGNNFSSQFLQNGRISWPLLFSIALAQHDLPIDTIQFGSHLPGSILDNLGITRPLSGPAKSGSYFVQKEQSNTSNVPGHVANLGDCVNRGKWLDKSLHMELGPEYRAKGDLQDKMVAAFKQALYFYLKYIPEKHNPWKLPDEIKNNMRKYPQYFDKMLQQKNNSLIFSNTTTTKPTQSIKDVQDLEESVVASSSYIASRK